MRSSNAVFVSVTCLAISLSISPRLFAQAQPAVEFESHESAIVDSATSVLREVMMIPAKAIPASLLAKAQGIVIIPGMIKGGFVIGAKHGRGVVMVRDPQAGWQLPQFISITGGSFGWQIGIQATDLILVFKTRKSVQGLLNGKFTIGADASAAAGPIGREASAATTGRLQAEILSYSRSRGLFAGLALDGSVLSVDYASSELFYRPLVAVPPGQPAPVPAAAMRLLQEINRHVKEAATVVNVVPVSTTPVATAAVPPAAPADLQAVRQQLAAASQRLIPLLDDQWKTYLALPAEVFGGDRPPAAEALEQTLGRFQGVAGNPQYAALTSRPEFVETLQLLQQLSALTPRPAIPLPPPPPTP